MNLDLYIGERIRELRNRYGLTQEELADRTELTKGFISQLERGVSSASVATLQDIVTCLGTNLSEFFREEQGAQVVYRAEDYSTKIDEEGNAVKWLLPTAQRLAMEPLEGTIQCGKSLDLDKPHEGEEFGYVIEGAIDVRYGDRAYRVKAGESFSYKSDRSHTLTGVSKKPARVLWISSPPSF